MEFAPANGRTVVGTYSDSSPSGAFGLHRDVMRGEASHGQQLDLRVAGHTPARGPHQQQFQHDTRPTRPLISPRRRVNMAMG